MNLIKSKESIGIFFGLLCYFSFSVLDAIQKTAVIYHSIFQLLLIKYCFTLILSFFESRRKKNFHFYKSNNINLQITRSILSVVESGCFVLAFRYLSLVDVHSVAGLTPVIVVVLSVIILKEKVSAKIWFAIFIGFIGLLIILRPGLSIFDPKSLIPLLGAFFLGLYQIVTRKVSENDSTETTLFYTSIIGILLMSLFAYLYWQPFLSISYILFLAIGIFFSLGIYFQIIALSKARASIIQPFHYSIIFWSIIWSVLFYEDIPDIFTIIGAIVITLSGVYVLKQLAQYENIQ